MLVSLAHFDWQILRAVLRTAGPPVGRDLRIIPSRRTKDGSFLDDLVAAGLLAAVGKPEPVDGKDEPAAFRKRYALTDLGRHAAEYGEYDHPFTPGDAPLSGKAAELHETMQASRRRKAKRG